jgi:ADP-ribose pyrophosphatase YjhB (NUDIX family)
MPETIIQLDSGGRHYLELFNNTVALCHNSSDRRPKLHEAFKRNLLFRIDGKDHTIAAESDSVKLSPDATRIDIFLGETESIKLASCRLIDSRFETDTSYILSPFETRFLAQNGFPHPVENSTVVLRPNLVTDLHSHFAGCVRPSDLIRIGIENRVIYPAHLLEEAGIHIESNSSLPLSELPREILKLLENHLAVPLDRRFTFLDMERIYRLRSPITKNPDAFIPLCRQIALDYRVMGADYVELSLSNIVEADRLRPIHRELPAIEEWAGIKIRFLAALSRHDDLEWDLDYIEQLKQKSLSRYIVGIDFMGHETNSTHGFTRQIREIAKWAHLARPGFVIRVHAGENPAHPENIRLAMEACRGYNVQMRIGHGLFGVDDRTLLQLKKDNVIVEFNLNSNLALNNIQTSREVPIRRYLDQGVQVVLGTDGYGIYQTSLEMESRAALISDLRESDFATIRLTELKYLEKRESCDGPATLPPHAFTIPDDLPLIHYTPEVMTRVREAIDLRDKTLIERLELLKIPLLDDTGLTNLLSGKRCISFAGAWTKSWNAISSGNQEKVISEMKRLIDELDPKEIVLITGGTKFGVENVIQQHACHSGFTILGTLVRETPPLWIEEGSITHAFLVGEKLHDKAAGLYRLMKDHNGLCLFIGGGHIVSDEIQTAYNLRLIYLLMDGPEGASSLHARQQPERAFTSAEEILEIIKNFKPWESTNDPYWHLGANPTVDIILTRHNPQTRQLEVLLIRRSDDAAAEPGKWAFPGGFQLTEAVRGTLWKPGKETVKEACIRELLEETNLNICHLESQLIHVGDYEGGGRDPRDTPQSWSRSTVFALHLPDNLALSAIAGDDDASDARWFPVEPRPSNLAFDHARILEHGLARLKEIKTIF